MTICITSFDESVKERVVLVIPDPGNDLVEETEYIKQNYRYDNKVKMNNESRLYVVKNSTPLERLYALVEAWNTYYFVRNNEVLALIYKYAEETNSKLNLKLSQR